MIYLKNNNIPVLDNIIVKNDEISQLFFDILFIIFFIFSIYYLNKLESIDRIKKNNKIKYNKCLI